MQRDMIIEGGAVFTPGSFQASQRVVIQDGQITAIERAPISGAARTINARGCTVAPGLVDVHVHGAAGYDTMDASRAGLAAMADYFARHGVTSFLPTTMTASRAATLAAVQNVAAYMVRPERGARVLGIHLEGPFLNPVAKGAQAEGFCRAPDVAELAEYAAAGPVRLLTLAPELPGAEALVRAAQALGISTSIGHTRADYRQAQAAIGWGMRHATHTYNAMPPLHHREPGAAGAILSDERIVGELIVDNIHLHPAMVALAIRAKGPARIALVTDAMRATGLPDGMYDLGDQPVVVRNGACWLADAAGQATQTLAGSTLTLDVALRNAMAAAGLSLVEALPMATAVPAASTSLSAQAGTLAPGMPADLILLDNQCRVVMTIVGGEIVYAAEEDRVIS